MVCFDVMGHKYFIFRKLLYSFLLIRKRLMMITSLHFCTQRTNQLRVKLLLLKKQNQKKQKPNQKGKLLPRLLKEKPRQKARKHQRLRHLNPRVMR